MFNTKHINQQTLITMTDMEGNLIQALIYLEKLNQDRALQEKSLIEISMPEEMRQHLLNQLNRNVGNESVSNVSLLIQAIKTNPYSIFSNENMPTWLNEIRFEIPHDIHMIFNGDFLDATSSPVPGVHAGIVHHQLLLAHILINTKNIYTSQTTLILGNRDINKVRDNVVTDPENIIAQAKILVGHISLEAFQLFKANTDKSDNAIKKFWYDHVTGVMFKEKLVWASQNPGDFFIYRGMITTIKTALENPGCSLETFKQSIEEKLSETYAPEDYLSYIYANTLGAPKALTSFNDELQAYYGDVLTLDSFLGKIRPLYAQLIERGQLMQRIILNDGSSLLFVHGHFSKKVLQCAEELKQNFVELLHEVPLDIADLDSIVNFYNQVAVIALANPGTLLWKKLQLIGFMGDPGSIITEPYTKFNDGTAVSNDQTLEEKYATAYQTLVLNSNLKAIYVGHLPQNGTSVYQDEKTKVLIFALDNGKAGYSLAALQADATQIIYVAKSYSDLLNRNIARRDFSSIGQLANETPELGKVVKFKAGETHSALLNPNNDAILSALLPGNWRVDAIDSKKHLVTLSQNTGPEQGFKNASITMPRSVFLKMEFINGTPRRIHEEKLKHAVISSSNAYGQGHFKPKHMRKEESKIVLKM